MKNPLCLSLALALPCAFAAEVCTQGAPASRPALSSAERIALSAASMPRLSDLRAGAPATFQVLRADERAALSQATNPSLRSLRAGDLSNSDLGLILIAVGVTLLILVLI